MAFYRIDRNHYYWERETDVLHLNLKLNIVNSLDADFLVWNLYNCPKEHPVIIDKDEFMAALEIVAFNMNLQVTVRV